MKAKNILKNSTLLFLILLPFFSLEIFYTHLSTLLMVSGVLLLTLLTIIFYKESRRVLKYLLFYYLLVLIYFLISYFYSFSFTSLVPGNFDYNIMKEALTILKLIMPITFLFTLKYQKISKPEYFRICKIWVLLFAGSIIITNFFKVSFSAYGTEFITKNIWEWNQTNYYIETASRGLFMYANQISLLLVLLLVIFVYYYLNDNLKSLFYITLLVLSMLMVGTRVASVGGLLVFIILIGLYFLLITFKKEYFNINVTYLLLPLGMWFLLLPISPYNNRSVELSKEQINVNVDGQADVENSWKKEYVLEHYNPNYLPKVFFLEYYPIDYDEDFWYNFVSTHDESNLNYRLIEKSIIKRVIEVDGRRLDKWLGISNTRIQNIVNIESDWVLHYYAFGLLGTVILLFCYLKLFYQAFKMLIKDFNFKSIIDLVLISLLILISFLTGNILNSLNVVLICVFIISEFGVKYEEVYDKSKRNQK